MYLRRALCYRYYTSYARHLHVSDRPVFMLLQIDKQDIIYWFAEIVALNIVALTTR